MYSDTYRSNIKRNEFLKYQPKQPKNGYSKLPSNHTKCAKRKTLILYIQQRSLNPLEKSWIAFLPHSPHNAQGLPGIHFWYDCCCGDVSFKDAFLQIFCLDKDKHASVADLMQLPKEVVFWNVELSNSYQDWEMDLLQSFYTQSYPLYSSCLVLVLLFLILNKVSHLLIEKKSTNCPCQHVYRPSGHRPTETKEIENQGPKLVGKLTVKKQMIQ